MSCVSCRDIQETDGVLAPCKTGRGCPVPPPGRKGARALGIRSRLITLGELVGRETVLRMHGATAGDVELMAVIEEELKQASGRGKDGKRPEGRILGQ